MRNLNRTRLMTGIGMLGILAWGMACTSEPLAGPQSEPVHTVTVSPVVDTAIVGYTLQFAATLRCQHGDPLDRPITWESNNPAVAIVSSSGMVTGVARGVATITATSEGKSASAGVTIIAPVNAVSIEPAVVTLDVGEFAQLSAALRDGEGNVLARLIEWSSSDHSVVDVGTDGRITAMGAGVATITATAEGKTGAAVITVRVPVASVGVTPATAAVTVGYTLQLSATPRDANGGALERLVDWTTSNGAVATVDATGLVTARAVGSVTITATSRGVAGTATITVRVPVATVNVSDPGSEPVPPGGTLQLVATAVDANGNILSDRVFAWSSSDNAVAKVDVATGLVTGVAQGTATISVTVEGKTVSVSVRVAGESQTTTLGNNLSNPVIFADGIGVTGLAVATDAGLRPIAGENITVTQLPFWYAGNVPDYGEYYKQQGANVWQAEWVDGSQAGIQQAQVAWGDNLSSVQFNTHQTIRIEVVLTPVGGQQLTGYNMKALYGSGTAEMQGADGTTALFTPTIYSVMPRMIIEKLDDTSREPVYTAFDGAVHQGFGLDGPGAFNAEVNVGGKLVYGYNLNIQQVAVPSDLHKYGWWRFTFVLDDGGMVGGVQVNRNTALASLAGNGGHIDQANNRTWIDINVTSASGGGGGGH